MSTTSGPGNKGEKNKGKFKSIDINTLYKGKSVETQKSNVPRQYGLQSLGKVSSARRMPPPANLPSIKSENSGKDPSVSLVPSGGTGWVSKEEKESTGGPPQQPSLPLQQATQMQPQQGPQQVTTKTNNSSGGQSSMGVRSWSSTLGGVRQGGLVSHRSPLFQEEFPSLAQEEKHKEPAPPTKKEDTVKDIQYGPGPSLRPQNVASWREGGGRALPQPKPEERSAASPNSTPTEAQPNGPLMSGGSGAMMSSGSGAGVGVGADLPSQPLPPQRPSSSHGQPHGSLLMGPPMRMPPPQHRGMLPHYMFGRISPGGYPINFPGYPRNPFPHDRRFRGPAPPMPVERSRSDVDDNQKRPAIVSEKALKDFDAVLKSDSLEGGWAEPQGDIDYSERLVFSDEEEDSNNTREMRRRPTETHQRDPDRDRDHKEDKDQEDEGGVMLHEGWPHGMPPPHYRGGPMPPHPGMDAHGWPPHMRAYEFMGPRGVAPYPFRLPPPLHMRGYGPPAAAPPPPPQPPVSSPVAGPPRKVSEDDDDVWRLKRRTNEGEINSAVERARMRREESEKKKESEQRAAADEKLRQLDERSKKKVDTKGSDTEGRESRDTSESSDREMRESHHWNRPTNLTPPALNEQADGKSFSRSVPPRFQKLQEPPMGQEQRQKQLPSPGGGASPGIPTGPPIPRVFRSSQGPPPHFAGYDPRAWPGMPPHFHMDPRYGPRPPLDMQAVYGPPTVMRRHDSHGSGNDGQESESRHLESYERLDPWAAWMERGYHPQAGHYEDIRRTSYYERAYQGFDIDRSDFEHHDHGPQTDTNKAPKEVEQRPTPHQRDSFEDWNKVSEKEEHRSDRSSSKDHTNWDLDRSFSKESNKEEPEDQYEKDEEFNQKPSKDEFDQEEPSYTRSYNRRDGRTGPTPKFRAYTSEEVRQREASQRAEVFSQSCPPPLLPHELNKQSVQVKASVTSLKRSASSMSSSSAVSSDKEKDRKNESPKESFIFERSLVSKKEGEKDIPKDENSPQDKENKPAEQSRPNAWEIKEQDRQKVSKVKEETEIAEKQKEEDDSGKAFEERVDSPRSNLPPGKKKREEDKTRDRRDRDREDDQVRDRRDREDEHLRDRRGREDEHMRDRRDREDDHVKDRRDRYSDDRREKDYDRYSDRGDRARGNTNRGGREFVRGRGAPRGSLRGGYSTGRGRDRDYFSTAGEKSGQAPHRVDRQPGKQFQKFDDDKHERDFGVNIPPRQKHGPDELSDVPTDDSVGVFHEANVTSRVHNKESLMEKERNHTDFTDNRQQETRGRDQNKDIRSDQEHKNIWAQDQKMQEEPIPSLFQNAWFKSQPLLPDPPKSDWIPDESYQKGNKTHNVWQQRLESRRPNIERSYGESHGSATADKHYEANHRDSRDNRQRHDRDRLGYNWGNDGQSERKDRRDNGPNELKNRRDNDQSERKERRDADLSERKEKRDNDTNERRDKRDSDPCERKEKRDSGSSDQRERRDIDPNERRERRDNDPNERKEKRDSDPHEHRERRVNDPNERREKVDNDSSDSKDRKDNDTNERKERRDLDSIVQKDRKDNDPNEWKVRRDTDPNERKEKRENDLHERKERSDHEPNDLKEKRDNDTHERKERRDNDPNEWKARRDNDPNERKEKREIDPHDRRERRDNDPNERKEKRESDPHERKERRDNDPIEWKARRDNDPNERKEKREIDPHDRRERRDNDPNERKERREHDPHERKERRDNVPNERKGRRDNDPQERKERRENDQIESKERREYDPSERKERRDNDPNERRDRRDNNPNERRETREIDPSERKERRDKYRDRDRYRDRRGHYQHDQDQDEENGTSYPRGEHPRRGRGGSRGGSRYSNNLSNYVGGGGGGQGYGGRGANGDSNISEHAGGFLGDHIQNRDRGHDGRDGHVDGRNHRRDGRRQDDRNPPPPRFRRDEVMFDHRGPGSDRGRGRSSRGQGAGAQSNSISKRPVLTKQMSNDGEEWETASESSEPKNGLRESRENMNEISTTKKGVSNQRPFSDRPSNHRLNYQDSRNSVERCNFHNRDDQQNQKNGAVPPMKSAANGAMATKAATVSIVGHKEGVTYRGDVGVTSETAGGSIGIARKQSDKKNDINDAHNKALKAEQERKDAMANIDINNIAGVVVVDDMQEVTLDDPDFLYEVNDGFQEVTSKRTLKIKQKLIEAEHKKTEKEALRKKEQHNKAAARSKCMSPKSGHMNTKGNNKLPPRLAKQKEQREKEKLMTKDVMPKIELWDNELANNLPCLDGPEIVPTSSVTFSDNIGVNVPLYTMTVTNKASMAPVMMSFSMTPAPAPPINAWMKPISFSPSPALGASQLQQALAASESHSPPQPVAPVPADVKMDKGDQHDSGIDVSDQPNSAASSSRSSPGTDNRLVVSTTISHSSVIDHPAAAVLKRNISMDTSQMITEIPKQQRLPKVSKSDKNYVKAEASASVMKKMDMSPVKELSDTKPEPIQMPPGYKDSIFGKGDHVNLELDFHYDESLSNSLAPISERAPTPEKVEVTFAHNENIHLSVPVASPQALMPPTSPATEVLSSKIASVKNFWDLDLPAYDHMACMTSAAPIDGDCQQSVIYVSNTNTNNVSSTSTANNTVFPVFGPEIVNNEGVTVNDGPPTLLEEDASSASVAASTVVSVAPVPRRSPVVQCMHSPHPAESAAVDVLDVSHSEMMHDEKSMILEPSNVCKVRPQQLQMGLGLGNEAISMSMLSSGISGSMLSSGIGGTMPTVASPPMMIGQHGFPAFQFGSQFVPQEARYTQPSFGYSLSQPQPPAGLGSQHQNQGPMGAQQTFSQPSLFISSTRTQAEYLSTSQLGFPQRGHGFGQPTAPAPPPAAQQSAIMAPSNAATLMPTNLKVPGSSLAMGPGPASAFGAEPLGKTMGPSQISFSNGLGSTSIPGAASQQLFFYDPNPTLGQLFQTHSQILTAGQASQNMASSQMLGSQLLQTRGTVQPSSAFYQQPPGTGYFPAQQSSAIQVGGPIQQPSSNQFSVQAFGNQHHGLGLAMQPPVSSLDMGSQNPSTMSLHSLPHQQSQGLSMTTSSKGSSFGSVVAGQQQTHQHFAATYNQQSPYSGHSHHPHHHIHSNQVNAFMGAGALTTPQDHISVKQFESSHPKTNITSSSNPNHFGDGMGACLPGSAMMAGMLVGNMGYNAGKSSSSVSAGAAHNPLDNSHGGVDRTTSMSISGPPSPQPPPTSQTVPKNLISRALDTSTSHLNPNAPVFPATTKYSCSTAVGVPSTSTSNITSTSAFVPSGTIQHQQQISVGKTRSNAVQGAHNVRPPFPNPIQRPDGPPVTSQPPDMQQFGPPNNNTRMPPNQVTGGHTSHSNSSFGAPVPNSPYLNAMNLRNTALLSLISAAKNVIDQTLMSSGSHIPGDNPFAGRAPGAYMGPTNMDGPPRPGPPTTKKIISQSVIHKGQSSAPQQNPVPNLGQSQNAPKVPVSFPGPTGSIKAQQALQRQELLTHAANFLNASKNPTASKPIETTGVGGNPPVSYPRKPALAMVSNPSLIGTSVKINFTASNNSRAPALPATTSTTVSATTSLASSNMKNSTNSSCTISVSAAPASSSVNSAGHKEVKENP